ncbi:hypothetical protein [Bradyrhizobium sp. SZCCHNS1054]|uniref:hypothetical protein n=1 Tax=Bradyrhizobium sp. SZCCHNS1054 TaxID=3057301 RepID=UPI0029161153|nr:hypothetical protein [Bradyrhizobium sp. SZCCHNS1054]
MDTNAAQALHHDTFGRDAKHLADYLRPPSTERSKGTVPRWTPQAAPRCTTIKPFITRVAEPTPTPKAAPVNTLKAKNSKTLKWSV